MPGKKHWTRKEIRYLKENHTKLFPEELADNLPARSIGAVKQRLAILRLKRKQKTPIKVEKVKRQKTPFEISIEQHDKAIREGFWQELTVTREELGL